MNKENKFKKNTVKNKIYLINKTLFELWDPIGINFNQNLLDEYYVYAQKIHQLYSSIKLDKLEIYNLLLNYEINSIGVEIEDFKRQNVADKIFDILNSREQTP